MALSVKLMLIICMLVITFLGGIYLAKEQIDYEVIDIENAPATVYEKYENQKFDRGFSVNPYDSAKYVLITMGTVPTAGYQIKIDRLQKKNQHWIIKSRFIAPDPDEIVAMVISYPAIVVKLPATAERIQVFANKEPLSQLE